MALFPRIQSPCPYKDNLAAVMDGDMCRMCRRQVTDITEFSDAQRIAFFKDCSGEVCVSYRVPVRAAIAAAALAAAATPALACDTQTSGIEIIVGGIKNPRSVEMVPIPIQAFTDKSIPQLPVTYDDKPAPKPDDGKAQDRP